MPVSLWEIYSKMTGDSGGEQQEKEWMYMLEDMGDDPYECYNITVMLWLDGAAEKAARVAQDGLDVTLHAEGGDKPAITELKAQISELIAALRGGAAPPRATLTDVGITVGGPCQPADDRVDEPRDARMELVREWRAAAASVKSVHDAEEKRQRDAVSEKVTEKRATRRRRSNAGGGKARDKPDMTNSFVM